MTRLSLYRYQTLLSDRRAVTGVGLRGARDVARVALNPYLARLQAHVWRH